MGSISGDPVIYVRISKILKLSERKKRMERNIICTGSRYCVRTNNA